MTLEEVVALVPMRHVSERVSGKNYRDFNGRPLYQHIVSTLLQVERVRAIVIDTDSALIAEQCRALFPSVQIVSRPKHLLGGHVPMTDVLRHDASVTPAPWYLQTHTTNPLLQAKSINSALGCLQGQLRNHDSLFAVNRLQTRLYDSAGSPMNHDPSELLRTQDLAPVYEENSNLYIFTAAQIAAGKRIGKRPLLFEMSRRESIDIDDEEDFVLAELAARSKDATR